MTRITKSEDAYFFAGSIIACKPTTPYYGDIEDVLFNNVIFAKVNYTAVEWTGNEIGLGMDVFSKTDAISGNTALTKDTLKKIWKRLFRCHLYRSLL